MMNWLDFALIAVLIYNALRGYFIGLIKSLTRMISTAVGLFAAYKFKQPLVEYINSLWHWTDRTSLWMSTWVKTKYVPFYKGEIPVINELSKTLAVNILELVAFAVIFFAVSRLIRLLGSFISGLSTLVFLKPMDRLGGTVFGLLKGVFVILVFLIIMTPLQVYIDMFMGGSSFVKYFDQAWSSSSIIPHFKEILKLLTALIPGLTLSNDKFSQYLDSIKKYSGTI